MTKYKVRGFTKTTGPARGVNSTLILTIKPATQGPPVFQTVASYTLNASDADVTIALAASERGDGTVLTFPSWAPGSNPGADASVTYQAFCVPSAAIQNHIKAALAPLSGALAPWTIDELVQAAVIQGSYSNGAYRLYGYLSTAVDLLSGTTAMAAPKLGFEVALEIPKEITKVPKWNEICGWDPNVPTTGDGSSTSEPPVTGSDPNAGGTGTKTTDPATGSGTPPSSGGGTTPPTGGTTPPAGSGSSATSGPCPPSADKNSAVELPYPGGVIVVEPNGSVIDYPCDREPRVIREPGPDCPPSEEQPPCTPIKHNLPDQPLVYHFDGPITLTATQAGVTIETPCPDGTAKPRGWQPPSGVEAYNRAYYVKNNGTGLRNFTNHQARGDETSGGDGALHRATGVRGETIYSYTPRGSGVRDRMTVRGEESVPPFFVRRASNDRTTVTNRSGNELRILVSNRQTRKEIMLRLGPGVTETVLHNPRHTLSFSLVAPISTYD